eukprot:TRINITY_DN15136_c0_g1_i2.p2 TRINITY_DN15136_c0_g1~~TRINITY_DN15136_c0_g1_i2.p2  ORF type:complete len:132 (+),score=18.40 TRINITY_DN15136_c0_g1_i2:64-459(+)
MPPCSKASVLVAFGLTCWTVGDASCSWGVVTEHQCGQSCAAEAYIGRNGNHYDDQVSDGRIDQCLERCRAAPACHGVNFVAVGKLGSGGPGQTSHLSGCCYYRTHTNCGVSCEVGNECFTLKATRGWAGNA